MPTHPTPDHPPTHWLKRHLKPHVRALIRHTRLGLAAVGAIWALAWLVAPKVIRWQIEHHASAALGRQVTVGAVDFKPWSLALTLEKFQVASADGTFAQLDVGSLTVNAETSSLWRWAPVLDAVRIDRPVVRLRHLGDGRHDWQDVIDKLSSTQTPATPDTGPARFAIYNIELLNGQVALHDVPTDNHHALTDITLAVPFVSTLSTAQDVRVQPKLAFKLNGSSIDTTADTQPFSDSLTTEARLTVNDLTLTPYLDYLPKDLPTRPTQATLDADLTVQFTQSPHAQVSIRGHINASDVAIADARQQTLLKLARASVALTDVRPLERTALLASVTLEGPTVQLGRDAGGLLSTQVSGKFSVATKSINKSAEINKSSNNFIQPETASPGWTVAVASFSLNDGSLHWTDAAMPDARQQPARLNLSALQAKAQQLRWPLPTAATDALSFEATAQLASPAADTGAASPHKRAALSLAAVSLSGTAWASQADASASVQQFDLSLLAPYLRPFLVPTVHGQLSLQSQLRWSPRPAVASGPDTPADEWALTVQLAKLDQFQLTDTSGQSLASWQSLSVRDTAIRPLAREAQLGTIQLVRPTLTARRDAQGQWMYSAWLPVAPTSAPPHAAEPTGQAEAPATPGAEPAAPVIASPWRWTLHELTVSDGQFDWRDELTTPSVAVPLRAVNFQVQGLASRGNQPSAVSASLRWHNAPNASGEPIQPGTLNWRGTIALGDDGQTPGVKGNLNALRLPVHTLAPYAADQLNLSLQRADASYAGNLSVQTSAAGTAVALTGDVTLENVRADTLSSTRANPQEWLRWQTLNLRGLDAKLAPGAPPQIQIERGALGDFFARIVLDETGRINLQDIRRPASQPALAAPTQPVATAQPSADTTTPRLRIGPFSLVNGSVDFSDQFIRPNYRANLSELTGRIGGFSSEGAATRVDGQAAPEMADIELRGKAEGTASLEITGKVNPLANPLALTIEGRVRDLELPPLSPYTIKYTGHGIERGKLSMDVGYTVLPNGQLTARNQLTLNQLTFGDPVPGATASLPVKLATALLADRHGVIDLNLPIAGSLNDPEFSVVPIVFKIIGNIIVKAVTAPFALLANALGGSDTELSTIAFVPGTARLEAASTDKLARVAQALIDRPALTLTVVGTASLDIERTAYQRSRLLRQVAAEQARSTGAAPDTPGTLTPDSPDYARWLTALYKRTDMPKPRNALGLAQELSVPDMEALLLTQIPVNESHMTELATQRGVAVRDQLARLAVPVQRLFLGAPGAAPASKDLANPAVAHLTLALR